MGSNETKCEVGAVSMDTESLVTAADSMVIVTTIVAVCFNLLTVVVLLGFCGTLNVYFTVVLNQCLANLGIALTFLAVTVPGIKHWPFVDVERLQRATVSYCSVAVLACALFGALIVCMLNLLVITLDHLFLVYKPRGKTVSMTPKAARCAIAAMYVFAVLCTSGALVHARVLHRWRYDSTLTFCEAFLNYMMGRKNMLVCLVGTLVIIVVLVMNGVYGYIIRAVHRKVPGAASAPDASKSRPVHYHTVVTSVAIIASFMTCFLTYIAAGAAVVISIRRCSLDHDLAYYTKTFTQFLPLVNCICNPAIYAVRLHKIRRGYRRMYVWVSCQQGRGEPQR